MDIRNFTPKNSPVRKGFLHRKKEEAKITLRVLATTVINCMSRQENDDTDILSMNLKAKFITFFLSFALGVAELGTGFFPFGISYFCASANEMVLPALAGVCLSCIFAKDIAIIQFITLVLLYMLRKTFTSDKYNEKVRTRVITNACTSIFIGTIRLFTVSDTRSIILFISYIALSVFTSFLFCHLFPVKKRNVSDGFYLTAIYGCAVCLVMAFGRISLFGIDFSLILSGLCTLVFSSALGPVYGCVIGFLSGFACSNPLYSACLGLSGLSSGFLRRKNFALSGVLFPIVSSAICIYLFGLKQVLQFCPFVLISSVLFLIFGKNTPSFLEFSVETKKSDSEIKSEKRQDSFNKISDSLSGLSNILYKFAEHFKAPSEAETSDIFDNALHEVCKSCSMNEMCYAKRQANLDNVKSRVVKILRAGLLDSDELSSMLLDKCIKSREMCDYINKHYSELNFLTMKSNRTQTVACLYSSMSHLIRTASKDETQDNTRDIRLEKKLTDALKKIGMDFNGVSVYGNRCKKVYVHNIRTDKIPCSSKDLCQYLSAECGIEFNEPTFDLSDSADTVMKLTRSEIISLEYAQCCSAKNETSVNGDTVNFFDTDKGYFYSIICDGMGSGKGAAATSRLSGVFLEKLLSAGTRKNVCLEMLNNLLLSKNDETFSTVDVLEVDKLCGTAYFIKAGAAPTFILRQNKLYKIASETPPVGIIHAFTAESTKFTLEKGDVIFMVSDGIIQSNDDAIWLSEIIRVDTRNEPAILASELMEKARVINTRRDDASVCIIKVM